MKLVHPEIETILQFKNGNFSSIIIENPVFFYRLIDDLYRQTLGESGSAVLSIEDDPIPIAGNLELLTDFFSFEINRKSLLTKLASKLEKSALSPEFYERSQHLLAQTEKLLYDLAFYNDLELDFTRLSISSLLKASGMSLKEDYSSLAEKLLVYMDLMTSNRLAELFVLVNIRSIFDTPTLEVFTDSCCRKSYNVLLIDNHEYPKLSRENRIIIDKDLCEI